MNEVTRPLKLFCAIRQVVLLFAMIASLNGTALGDSSLYLDEVKPLLKQRCYACHGALKQEAGLRLDTVESMRTGGDSGPVLMKGRAANSLLLERITAEDVDWRMPPADAGEPLTANQIASVRQWIVTGAAAPSNEQPQPDPREHWAFQPIVRPELPQLKNNRWVRNPIDAFVARQHELRGLTPQSEATREILLRRLSLDLIGLPPTPEEIAAVQSDPEPDWYGRAITRLLADPRYGERWGRHWMDVWRYSDWWGLGDQLRNSQKHIWHWRDWIIESLNADLPYDRMVRLMLAGDELAPNDLQQLPATGYLARNYFLFNRNQWMDETVEHVSKAFLGLTTNCAKCHDHKYDPISQTEYYRLRAIFEPYHVRLDVVPGEPDLNRDGIPRAFDGVLDAPTWRFIRGDEKNPDKSQLVEPGLPEVLRFTPLQIEPVELPAEASQPELRPWVAEAYQQAARKQVEAAESELTNLREKVAQEEHGEGSESLGSELRLELRIAEQRLGAAKAELRSVEQRTIATRRCRDDHDRVLASAAARAERELAVAKARLALSQAELRSLKADARNDAEKSLKSARAGLDEALSQVAEPGDQFTPLEGARWTPTRFQFSGKDDPAIPFPSTSTGRRKALAEWLTDPRNPLTARVAVNHLWTRHFGTPLVPTVFDFGRNGQPPSHPQLLDWLASEFIDSGWSMKRLHRLIVESATYRLTSSARGAENCLVKDPDNIWLWRRTPGRLESQAVRDSLLALAGTLDTTQGGPPVPADQQDNSKRRSIYFFHSNNQRNLFLTLFDEALVTECYRREQSIIPQQALALTNSQLVLDLSPLIAQQITQHLAADGQANDDETFVRTAFVVLLASEPTAAERAASLRSLAAWRELPEQVSARSQLVWVLLNHSDFVTIR